MTPSWSDHLLVLVLCVLFPLYAARSYRTFVQAVREGRAKRISLG